MPQQSSGAKWRVEETILALNLCLRCRKRNRNATPREISGHIELLSRLGLPSRSSASIIMKMGNFAALDPQNSSKGLSSAADQDRRIWNQYANSPGELQLEVRRIQNALASFTTSTARATEVRQHRFDQGLNQRPDTNQRLLRSRRSSGRSWRVEETILALDLYLRCRKRRRYPTEEEIQEHRDLLWRLGMPFRNANTISMKMGDFTGLDRENPDRGLSTASSQDRRIWRQLASTPEKLQQEVTRIKGGKS